MAKGAPQCALPFLQLATCRVLLGHVRRGRLGSGAAAHVRAAALLLHAIAESAHPAEYRATDILANLAAQHPAEQRASKGADSGHDPGTNACASKDTRPHSGVCANLLVLLLIVSHG